jgi:hypothetical protein
MSWRQILGRRNRLATDGSSSLPVVNPTPLPPGANVAIIAQHTSDGGAWPGLLPGDSCASSWPHE